MWLPVQRKPYKYRTALAGILYTEGRAMSLAVVAHAVNPNPVEAEAGGPLSSRPARSTGSPSMTARENPVSKQPPPPKI